MDAGITNWIVGTDLANDVHRTKTAENLIQLTGHMTFLLKSAM
jgi:hypothetical protein